MNTTYKSVAIIFVLLSSLLSMMVILPAASEAESNGKVETVANLSTSTSNLFAGSGVCATCHSQLLDAKGNDVSIDRHWRSSMMANSAKDPFWQAKVASEVDRTPSLKPVIEDICAKCHMPMARTQAAAQNGDTGILGDGFLNPANRHHQLADDGVSCSLCHQTQDIDLGEEPTFSGNYSIDLTTRKPFRRIFGPFFNPWSSIMQRFSGYLPVYNRAISASEQCASCHTLYTPYTDDQGTILGRFPEQTPYLEWEESIYAKTGTAKSCQDCHMPIAETPVVVSNRGMGMGGMGRNMLPARPDFSQHTFAGGNEYMLRLLRDNTVRLGLNSEPQHFNQALAAAEESLQRSVDIWLKKVSRNGNDLAFTVKMLNQTGHKFPTGFPSRRAWLHVTVTDASGATVFESGAANRIGRIRGNLADFRVLGYEDHHDVITREDQVQIYESIAGDVNGRPTYALLRAAEHVKDNRLPPRGFRKNRVHADIAVHGKAEADNNFNLGQDLVRYLIPVDGHTGPFTVRAELRYQSIGFRFLKDLETSTDRALVTRFSKLARETENRGYVVNWATTTIQ